MTRRYAGTGFLSYLLLNAFIMLYFVVLEAGLYQNKPEDEMKLSSFEIALLLLMYAVFIYVGILSVNTLFLWIRSKLANGYGVAILYIAYSAAFVWLYEMAADFLFSSRHSASYSLWLPLSGCIIFVGVYELFLRRRYFNDAG
ncbi:hypothetical protein [Paenibacillus sp. HB172176]|uniref:hypothetical protein n=1 Tax=Paenibacillus sp. HB172176 TaxID=2493690 RepID=UPI0014387AF9|nr:hypothetical protein [Paenibacillus sp. HB172176]